ncbi:MAG: putative DNA-binding domain-containing protein [Alphaproteobacteria bacterium]
MQSQPDLKPFNLKDWQQDFIAKMQQAEANSPNQPIAVYGYNLQHGMINALKQRFPACLFHLGAARFDVLCDDYIAKNLPTSAIMAQYGNDFEDFIKRQDQLPAYLYDLARLENMMVASFHAPFEAAFDTVKSLAHWDESVLFSHHFQLCEHVSCLLPASDILTLYQAFQRAESMPFIPEQNAPRPLLIARPGKIVEITAISPVLYQAIHQIANHQSLETALLVGLQTHNQQQETLTPASLLHQLFSLNIIKNIHLETKEPRHEYAYAP